MSVLQGKRIILGVTGSIAAYKAAELASQLTQMGALPDVILTPAAEKFIAPLTFQSVTGRRAYTEADLWGGEAHVLHVGVGHSADLLVIAPCTANTIASLAHGLANNLLTITALAAQCRMLIAPAMDGGMLDHPATQENLAKLRERGATIIGPAEGHLASGLSGKGRLLEAAEIIGHIRLLLGREGRLAGKKIVISAGGTQEPLDPVRVLSNRSSGKQGYALAQAAIDLGAQVTLVTAPSALEGPGGGMRGRGRDRPADAGGRLQCLPRRGRADHGRRGGRLPPQENRQGQAQERVTGSRTSTSRPRKTFLRASAESSGRGLWSVSRPSSRNLLDNAAEKLKSKRLDLIVANDISAKDSGFGSDTNRVTLIYSTGTTEPLPLAGKSEVAELILERVAGLLE